MRRKKAVKRFKVLVVNDKAEISYRFQRALGGPQVVALAEQDREALEKVKESFYNLVFLDVRLPGTDAVKVFEAIKETAPETVVVMTSDYPVGEEIKMAMALSPRGSASKPPGGNDEIMTIQEVARYLSLHELTVRRLAREGELPAFKIGRQWRIKKEILNRWIEEQTLRNISEAGGENA
ncbi:MAG: helix-turn-helix domain-containing protein [Anaerolineae bacterium]